MLYLPLDKIVAQVSAESAQASSNPATPSTPTGSVTVGGATGVNNPAPAPAPSSTPAVNNADKRDGLRSRDREAR